MLLRSLFSLSLVALLATSACAHESRDELTEEVEYTLDFTPGKTLSVNSRNGSITLETWDRDEVNIYAIKKAKARNHGQAENLLETTIIEIEETSRGLEVRTHREDKWKIFKNANISVNYTITVPEHVVLKLESVNGSIEALPTVGNAHVKTVNGRVEMHGTYGFVKASSVNGAVKLTEIHGAVNASTVNGQLRIEIVEQVDEDIEAQTVNGQLRIALPHDFQGRVQAQTMNGGINTDFPITVKGRIKKSLRGNINGGDGPSIQLQTLNGAIKIEEL